MKNILIKGLSVFASILLVTSSASAMTCTNLTKPLSKGSENSEVLALQQFLFDGGYLTAKPNGYYGAGTVAAVKKFQKVNGLSQVGSIGTGTRGKIKEVSCRKGEVVSTESTVVSTEVKESTIKETIPKSTTKINFIEIGHIQNKPISATSPLWINGKLAYVVADREVIPGMEKDYIVYDGKVIGKDYYTTGRPFNLSDKLGYVAWKNDGKHTLVYDGVEYDGKVYDTNFSSPLPVDIGGKLAYIVSKDNKTFINYDGKEIGKEYDYIYSMLNIGGKLAYTAIKNKEFFVVYDDIEIGKEYHTISGLLGINGKVAFIANKGNKNFIVYDGKEFENGYSSIKNLVAINGKLAYLATKNGKTVAVYDNVEISKDYDEVHCMYNSTSSCLVDVKGKVAYIAIKNKKYFVIYDGKEVEKDYPSIQNLVSVNGKLAYEVYKDSKTFVVYDGVEVGKEFGKASNPVEVNGKLAFTANEKGAPDSGYLYYELKYFIVMEK